jgi:hypothetical protein
MAMALELSRHEKGGDRIRSNGMRESDRAYASQAAYFLVR